MANTFKRYASRNIGTSPVSIGSYTVGAATQTTLIGLSVANKHANTLTVSVEHYDGANATKLVQDAPVPAGGALVVVGADQKVVLETGDSVRVTSNEPTSCDVLMSLLEIT
jgi:hypothetical protein